MMRKTFAIAGIILVLIPESVSAIETSLYRQIRRLTENKLVLGESELNVQRFIPKIIKGPDVTLTEEDVDLALQRRYFSLCEDKGAIAYYGSCTVTASSMRQVTEKEEWVRTVGRDLQLIASSYEISFDDYPGRHLDLLVRMPSIIKIWQSAADQYLSPSVETNIRIEPYPDKLEGKLDAVGSALSGLKKEEPGGNSFSLCMERTGILAYCEAVYPQSKEDLEKLTAAVWRYRHGYQKIREKEGDCASMMDGTELQHLKNRWCNVEDALEEVWNELQDPSLYDPPPSGGETILFKSYELEDLGIFIWIRYDDVGLMWDIPFEPILPSLDCSHGSGGAEECVDGAILGGKYPDPPEEPEPGIGLCSHPFSRKGYLCRPIESEWCSQEEKEEGNGGAGTKQENSILLTECRVPQFKDGQPEDESEEESQEKPPPLSTRITESGPNICYGGPWRLEPEDKEQKDKEDDCRNCTVKLTCGGCAGILGKRELKNDEGEVEVCVIESDDIPATYIALSELVHAQQACNLPPGTALYETHTGCCARGWEASLVSCNAMAEDGVFDGTNITIEKCAAALTNVNCILAGYGECTGEEAMGEVVSDVTQDLEKLYENIIELVKKNPAEVPTSCTTDPDQLDPRAKSLYYSMSGICNPQCRSQYANTIGNNLCFAGQCLEQSLEEHRLIPGRWGFVDNDEAYPWDSCSEPDPEHGNILALPSAHITRFPPYNPALLVQTLDKALCQINGLPALTPPVRCLFDGRRRLELPLPRNPTPMGQSLATQPEEVSVPMQGLEDISLSVGARIGTNLYVQYLHNAMRTFRDLLDATNRLMKDITETEFSDAMCPRLADDDVCRSESTEKSQ